MVVALEIERMTTSEKISVMESLWDDLYHNVDSANLQYLSFSSVNKV
jgi:hypothetical protein